MEEELFIEIGSKLKEAEKSQMFGKPCYKINSKAFMCFFQGEMVFKLPEDVRATAIKLKGAQLFDPSGKGRQMKEWIQVPYVHAAKWAEFAKAAMGYVNG